MCMPHFSPAARDWQKNLGRFLHKGGLLFERKHQISVALSLRREGSEFPASYTKSGQTGVRILFHAFQAQGNPAKICWGHLAIPTLTICHECSSLSLSEDPPLHEAKAQGWDTGPFRATRPSPRYRCSAVR